MTEGLIKEFWAIISAFVGVIVWGVRLEGRSKKNSADLERHILNMKEQRAEDLLNRQRDWDVMNSRLDSIQTDIKELLQRTSR